MNQSVTGLLNAIAEGTAEADDELLPLIYQELRAVAKVRLRGHSRGNTLSTTALVHEAYLKLLGSDSSFSNRRHFYATAALAMRQILVDQARRRLADKRGAGLQEITFDEQLLADAGRSTDVVALDAALEELKALEPRLAEVVHLRFFAGLELSEVAGLMEVSQRTVGRDWQKARAFLHARLSV